MRGATAQRVRVSQGTRRAAARTQGETIMTQLMLTLGDALLAPSATRRNGIALVQKSIGFAIFGSGLAVIAGYALRSAFGA
jgi:hypothetical protein